MHWSVFLHAGSMLSGIMHHFSKFISIKSSGNTKYVSSQTSTRSGFGSFGSSRQKPASSRSEVQSSSGSKPRQAGNDKHGSKIGELNVVPDMGFMCYGICNRRESRQT